MLLSPAPVWQDELKRLVARMAAVGMAPDIDSMELSEQRAVYRVLCKGCGMSDRAVSYGEEIQQKRP